jgi:hypothetical protein
MSELGFLTECPLCHQTFWVAEANDVVPRHDDPARGTWCAGSKLFGIPRGPAARDVQPKGN